MHIPSSGGPTAEPSQRSTDPHGPVSGTPVAHGVCCAVGIATTIGFAAVFYAELVAVVAGLRMLSTTALVFVLLWLWIAVWAAAEVTWGWRAARLSADR